jgi:hypothetical protein
VLAKRAPQRVQRRDAACRQAGAGGEPARGGKADPDSGEGARPEADGNRPDGAPSARRLDRPLDLRQQGGRVARAAVGPEPEQRLVQDGAAARRADRGVLRRRVEADDGAPSVAVASQ